MDIYGSSESDKIDRETFIGSVSNWKIIRVDILES